MKTPDTNADDLMPTNREETCQVGSLPPLKKLVGDDQHWPWALEYAKALSRHFGDLRVLDHLGESADFSLSHGAVELAAGQALADIAPLRPRWQPNARAAYRGALW